MESTLADYERTRQILGSISESQNCKPENVACTSSSVSRSFVASHDVVPASLHCIATLSRSVGSTYSVCQAVPCEVSRSLDTSQGLSTQGLLNFNRFDLSTAEWLCKGRLSRDEAKPRSHAKQLCNEGMKSCEATKQQNGDSVIH
jgi:hypothetical protein